MKIQDYGYDDEKSFVRDALVSPEKRELLKQSLAPLAQKIGEFYVREQKLDPGMLPMLTEIGMEKFDKAFSMFMQNPVMYEKEGYKFSTYFSFWIKMSIEKFLGIFDEDEE